MGLPGVENTRQTNGRPTDAGGAGAFSARLCEGAEDGIASFAKRSHRIAAETEI